MTLSPMTAQSQLHNFAAPPTTFIGRAAEVARIGELLVEPACRLLTLTGSGGVGKTRLALRVVPEVAPEFSQGLYFVSLQPLQTPDLLAPAIAEAVGLSLSGQTSPETQVLTYLRDKEVLLLLDNFEQLLAPSAAESAEAGAQSLDLLTAILNSAPAVTLLVTSREALKLRGEWLFPVRGLAFPKRDPPGDAVDDAIDDAVDDAVDIEDYAAVRLFVERARQNRPDFSLAEARAGVVHICRLVEGIPLALELAASWTKTLRCAEIAARIEQNLAFLATRLRDVPERHRTMQAVFDHSWDLLTDTERAVFKRLSVFQAAFRRSAAARVAGATLPLLSALVDKSLLRWEPDGHYHMHALLRHYAAERLQETPTAVSLTHERHGLCYAGFLHRRLDDVLGGRQQEAAAEIEPALDNIRAAWQWAVARSEVEPIHKAAQTLSLFYQFQGRYLEGARAFEAATRSLESLPPTGFIETTLVLILVDRAWFYIRLGWLEQAETVLTRCRAIYERLDRPPVPGHGTDPLLPLGIIASIHGDYAEAARLGEKVRQVSERHNHLRNQQFAYYLLARAALGQGQVEAAGRYARQAYALSEQTQDRWFMAYCHNELGHVAQALGDYDVAQGHYATSYAIRREFDDPEGMAVALTYLGEIALAQEDVAAAEPLYRQSLTVYEAIHDQGGIATAWAGLGHTACAAGDYRTARRHFHQALHRAREIDFVPLILSILTGVGQLLWQSGAEARGVAVLALVRHHPASDPATQATAQQHLTTYEAALAPDAFATALRHGQAAALETMATTVQAELAAPQEPPVTIEGAVSDQFPQSEQALIEPLTPREAEVLHLIAEGHTNQEIAEALFIVEGTVKAHASNIYGKLQVSNRTEAVAKAQALAIL